jgi:O-antigen/teichoic acid export membrane protein
VQRAFILNLILLVLINLLIKPLFIFGVDLQVQNNAAPGAYGLYFALLNWTFLLQIVHDFGLQNFNSRFVSQHNKLQEKYFPIIIRIKIGLTFVYMIGGALLAWLLGGYSGNAMLLLLILFANQAITGFILLFRSSISALGHYTIDSFLSAMDKLLMLILCGIALWIYQTNKSGYFPLYWFVLCQSLSLLFTLIIVIIVLKSKGGWRGLGLQATSGKRFKQIALVLMRQSAPFAIVILLMSAYTRLDAILLERIHPNGAFEADIYAGGYRLLDAFNMLGYLFATLLLPMFAKLLAQKQPIKPLTGQSFRLIWIGALSLCTAVTVCRLPITALMFEREVHYRADVLGILIWAFLAVCTTYIFSTLLTADARLRTMNQWFIAGIALDIILNIVLVPKFAAVGAAIATVATQAFVAVAMIVICRAVYDISTSIKNSVTFVAYTASILGVGYFFVALKWDLAWHWQLSVILLMGLLLVLYDIAANWAQLRAIELTKRM